MLLVHGKRNLRIKRYTNNEQICRSCGSFDMDVQVYKQYYHFFFIPFFPIGDKTVLMRCKSCGEPLRSEAIQKQYEEVTKNPFYLYSGLILVALLVVALVFSNNNTQKEKVQFVNNPKVGDVYGIRKNDSTGTSYYFLRLSKINGDTVFAYHNNLVYDGFVSKFHEDDFFVKDDEMFFMKDELKVMLGKDFINSVERGYGTYEGFERIK